MFTLALGKECPAGMGKHMKTGTVKGADIQPGQVVKIGGRWLRVVEWPADSQSDDLRYALVAAHGVDPRMAQFGPSRRSSTGRYRVVWADEEYMTREEPAPVWDWVTRKIERNAQI